MRRVEVVEIYVPAYRDFGWIRARKRWGRISTFKLRRSELEEMAHDVLANLGHRPAIEPTKAMRDKTYAARWPPVAKPRHGSGESAWAEGSGGGA